MISVLMCCAVPSRKSCTTSFWGIPSQIWPAFLAIFVLFLLFIVETHDQNGFLKHLTILFKTTQLSLSEYRPLSQTSGNAINFEFFWKKNLKENKHLGLGAKIEIKKFVNCFDRHRKQATRWLTRAWVWACLFSYWSWSELQKRKLITQCLGRVHGGKGEALKWNQHEQRN